MKTWLIDAGHGGSINGVYQTYPNKMHSHSDNEIFYEGVSNRIIKKLLTRRLSDEGIPHIDISPSELDISLANRVKVANIYSEQYKDCVLVSLHSNAGGGTGFEVWTSVGQTDSDKYANILSEQLINDFDIPFRADTQDGDLDKESAFYILKWTQCPAILPECLFFDNYSDYKKLIDPTFRADYVDSLVSFIQKANAL